MRRQCLSKHEEKVRGGAMQVSGGRAFQTKGTANAKVLRQDVQQLQGTGARQVVGKE